MGIVIRDQRAEDCAAVHALIVTAFKTLPVACGREQFVMDALWRCGEALALVAEDGGVIVGQCAFSKVMIGGADCGWQGLGPVAVVSERQRQGCGAALIEEGLRRLRASGAKGCVVVGHPAYYPRFGFRNTDAMSVSGVPPEVFMALSFGGSFPSGEVKFHAAFEATA
jgi:putative acetyltransferase